MRNWVRKDAEKPARGLVYHVLNLDGSVSFRAYDDLNDSWWYFGGKDGWVPNNSFTHWLPHEALPPRPADTAWVDGLFESIAAQLPRPR